eukprot:CAMPEP_0182451568 /NCGR_PEP_ID=MMETSP1172-20130603/43788_1 /TAXON_ID=708627 /ORGANISM="Timspurckia oligopyrenoides, Strain CCMP3278" /LENGTH=582 /DNA_ID=CAMNT_0024649351 /DNA_START=2686 /DNA_END=4431 /DNA_ORIENTATION=+
MEQRVSSMAAEYCFVSGYSKSIFSVDSHCIRAVGNVVSSKNTAAVRSRRPILCNCDQSGFANGVEIHPVDDQTQTVIRSVEIVSVADTLNGTPVNTLSTNADHEKQEILEDKVSESRIDQECEKKKLFVLDTNVILHNSHSLYSFDDNDLCVPLTVIEELDKFKRGNEEINYNAREFVRFVDDLCEVFNGEDFSELITAGIQLGDGLGHLRLSIDSRNEDIERLFFEDCPDHRILSTLSKFESEQKYKQVVLVTKDVNLRMKARALGFCTQDYTADQIQSKADQLYTGKRVIEGVSSEAINVFFQKSKNYLDLSQLQDHFQTIPEPTVNENFVLRNCTRSVLATYRYDNMSARFKFERVEKRAACGILPRNSEQIFALDALLNPELSLVSISGKAGTGKTLLAIAAALELEEKYGNIFISRPVVPLSNRDSGFLPGSIESKLDPYMQPLFDSIEVIRRVNTETNFQNKLVPNAKGLVLSALLESEKLKVAPLAYIRGRSIHNAYFIVDEAQNLSPHEIRTIVTRAGEGTKIVFTGDIFQIDNPYADSRSNGLSYLIERMRGQKCYAHITLEQGERSELARLA